MDSTMSVADALLLNDRKDDGGMMGGSWIWIILLFFLFGGNNGFGGNKNNDNGISTKDAVSEGFQYNQLDNGIRGIQNGLCNSTYELSAAIKDCCCTTNRNIDSVKYDMSKGFCDVVNAGNLNTRDIITNQNAGTQRILDYMCANEKQALYARINSLETAGTIQAQTANIIEQLRPFPQPAYITCSPYASTLGNCGCGCGCGV